jgi:hypothetical protein
VAVVVDSGEESQHGSVYYSCFSADAALLCASLMYDCQHFPHLSWARICKAFFIVTEWIVGYLRVKYGGHVKRSGSHQDCKKLLLKMNKTSSPLLNTYIPFSVPRLKLASSTNLAGASP